MGLAGYYRRCIKSFSHIAYPIRSLQRKDKKSEWTEECVASLKQSLLLGLPKQPTSRGEHVMREFAIRDSTSLVTLRKWNRQNISNKPIHINNNTLKRHVTHSNILSLSPTNILSLLTPSHSHAIGMTVSRRKFTLTGLCASTPRLFSTNLCQHPLDLSHFSSP